MEITGSNGRDYYVVCSHFSQCHSNRIFVMFRDYLLNIRYDVDGSPNKTFCKRSKPFSLTFNMARRSCWAIYVSICWFDINNVVCINNGYHVICCRWLSSMDFYHLD